jgi:hypothetical protein
MNSRISMERELLKNPYVIDYLMGRKEFRASFSLNSAISLREKTVKYLVHPTTLF